MQRDDEDDVWKAIVENYGDRPQLDDPPPLPEEPPPFAAYLSGPLHGPEEPEDLADPERDAEEDPDAFVPPDPPLTRPALDRLAAWLGVLAVPALLLVFLVLSLPVPRVVSLVLVLWFVLGFLYLVWRMPREPRDPWDDGAQV